MSILRTVEGTADCGFVICGQRNRLRILNHSNQQKRNYPTHGMKNQIVSYMSPLVGLEKLKLQK